MESGRDYDYWKVVANTSNDFIDFLFSKYLTDYEQSELLVEFEREVEIESENIKEKSEKS